MEFKKECDTGRLVFLKSHSGAMLRMHSRGATLWEGIVVIKVSDDNGLFRKYVKRIWLRNLIFSFNMEKKNLTSGGVDPRHSVSLSHSLLCQIMHILYLNATFHILILVTKHVYHYFKFN